MLDDLTLAFGISAFISVLAIVNPLSTIGIFLSLTKNNKVDEANRIAFRSSLVAFCVLIFFSLSGFFLFQMYGITLEAFRIAGGIILFAIGLQLVFPSQNSQSVSQGSKQIYLIPLAIPMTSGPGAITTTIVLASQAVTFAHELMLWVAIFLACAINYLVLRFAESIHERIGKEGLSVLIKIMGLLVCAIGVQFIINGLKVAFPIFA